MSNYNQQVFKQLEELTIKFDSLTIKFDNLTIKNEELTIKNEKLVIKFEKLTLENKRLTKSNERLLEKVTFLESENIRKDKKILRLKAQIDKDSSNSSKPPSSDNFKKIPNSREKSSKNSGGQPGHKSHCLKLPENFEELVASGRIRRDLVDHTNGAEKYITRWIVDVKFETVYTEHRFPLGTRFNVKSSVIYGENLKSLSVLLSNEGIIAQERLSDFFSEVSNGLIILSDATIESFNFTASKNVDVDALKIELLNGEVMHVDETSLRCVQTLDIDEEGQEKIKTAKNSTFNAVVRTHSNEKTTLYTVNPKKDDEGVKRDNILTRFFGIVSQDHDKKFYKYGNLHATCGAHLSRELKGLSELYHLSWAKNFRTFYLRLNDYKKTTKYCDPEKLSEFELRYDELIDTKLLKFPILK